MEPKQPNQQQGEKNNDHNKNQLASLFGNKQAKPAVAVPGSVSGHGWASSLNTLFPPAATNTNTNTNDPKPATPIFTGGFSFNPLAPKPPSSNTTDPTKDNQAEKPKGFLWPSNNSSKPEQTNPLKSNQPANHSSNQGQDASKQPQLSASSSFSGSLFNNTPAAVTQNNATGQAVAATSNPLFPGASGRPIFTTNTFPSPSASGGKGNPFQTKNKNEDDKKPKETKQVTAPTPSNLSGLFNKGNIFQPSSSQFPSPSPSPQQPQIRTDQQKKDGATPQNEEEKNTLPKPPTSTVPPMFNMFNSNNQTTQKPGETKPPQSSLSSSVNKTVLKMTVQAMQSKEKPLTLDPIGSTTKTINQNEMSALNEPRIGQKQQQSKATVAQPLFSTEKTNTMFPNKPDLMQPPPKLTEPSAPTEMNQTSAMPKISLFKNNQPDQIAPSRDIYTITEVSEEDQMSVPSKLQSKKKQPEQQLSTPNFPAPPQKQDPFSLFKKTQQKYIDTKKDEKYIQNLQKKVGLQVGKDSQPIYVIPQNAGKTGGGMTFPRVCLNLEQKQAREIREKTHLKLRKVYEILSSQDENLITQNAAKIEISMRNYLTIDRNVNESTYFDIEQFEQSIGFNEGVNKLLNDFTCVIAKLYQIPDHSYRLLGELFYKMLQQERFSDQLFDGLKLKKNQVINKRIYRVHDTDLILMWEENESAQLICQFIRYFSSLTTQCLKKIENHINCFKKTTIFQLFLETTLLLNERLPRTENNLIIQSMKASDLRLSNHLNKIISILIDSWLSNQTTIEFISRDHILKLIPVVNELPISASTKLFQKILLKALNLDRIEEKITQNKKIIVKIAQTNCKLLLPFRVILHRLDRSKKSLEPFQKDLFQQIDGFEWVDWLSLYLGEDNLRLNQKQIHYVIKAMKTMRIKNIDKITSKQSQIRRLIHLIMQQGQVKNFYQTLSALIYDENSIKKVEKQFFNEGRIFNDDLRLLADEIRKFPNCEYNEQDIPQLHAKSLYFLTTLSISPERALQYENALFDMMGFIDNISDRCDRVCHLIIDILAYFSVKQFDDQIIIKCFDAMISLISTNSTKQYMTLAMNVNRPEMNFFNKNIPRRVISKIDRFLSQVISSKQFYESTRVNDQSINLSRAYPFRYSIEKYLSLTTTYIPTIPLYWFSNCLKMSAKQSYNPELFETILSRLRINPSKAQLQQIPYVLVSIVEACNTSNFWKDLNDHLTASNYYLQNKFGVYNKFLTQKPDFQVMLNVFFSINLLKTMLQLRRIRNLAQRSFPKHFISQLLSSLTCLNELDRQYMQGTVDIEIYSTRSISPIVGLLSLTSQDTVFINTSASIKTEWLYSRYDNINIEELKKIHSKTAQNINYQILRDVLVHPRNKHLDCYENVSSLAYSCLNQIISETKDVSIEGLLYMCIPKNKQSSNIQDFNYLKAQIIGNFVKALDSSVHSLNRHAWKLLTMIRNSSQNKKIAQQIFREYNKLYRRYGDKVWNMKYLIQFLSYEVKQGSFIYSDLITDLLESMQKSGIENMANLLISYDEKSQYIESLHQFERLTLERKIISVSQKYKIIQLMSQIILNQLYINGSTYFGSLTRHSSILIRLISDANLPNVYSSQKEAIPNLALDDSRKGPRLSGSDILQLYITNNQMMARQQLVLIQVQNVINWCNRIMDELNKNITTFLSVILSIDETYYSNHAMRIKSKNHPQIFCQLHIPVANYRGQQLVGKNQSEAIIIIKILIDEYLGKIQKLKQVGQSNQIVKTYALIDMLLEWLKCSKNTKKADLSLLCKKVLTICFSWLGGPSLQPYATKLLLTCTNILQNELTQDVLPYLKETIVKTLESAYTVSPDIKQELLILLLIVPPEKKDTKILQLVSKLWCYEQNNQYFYNQCRVMMKLCELYPVQMAKFKMLSKCERILRFSDSALQGIRYREGMRTIQSKSWVWILKVATCLLENGGSSTIVVHEVSKFIQSNKKRLIFTFNQPRQSINLKNKIKNLSIELSLAQLDQLEASLQLFIVLSQSKMWAEMNRILFEEMFYYLMHRTIVVFAPSSMGDRLKKRYIPFSINQKVMWKLHAGEGFARQQYEQMAEGYDPDRVDEEITSQLIDFASLRPSVFILGMSLRFNECLKLWLLACSTGMRCSCFVREYFSKPITTDYKGSTLKYSLTHWDHHNKAITQIIQSLISRIKEWGKWEDKPQLLNLLNDSFSSAEFFTEAGYLYSIVRFPKEDDELITELGESLSLALQMGACHLASQVFFRNKNGTFSRENLQNFQQKLLRLQALGKQKLVQNKISRQEAVFDHLSASKTFLKQIQI